MDSNSFDEDAREIISQQAIALAKNLCEDLTEAQEHIFSDLVKSIFASSVGDLESIFAFRDEPDEEAWAPEDQDGLRHSMTYMRFVSGIRKTPEGHHVPLTRKTQRACTYELDELDAGNYSTLFIFSPHSLNTT